MALEPARFTDFDLPAVFRAADAASASSQSELLLVHKANSILLVAAALLALAGSALTYLNIASAALFLLSLGATVYAEHFALQRRWYQARALAESVKTASWRLMMGAEPFARPDSSKNLARFRSLLAELLQQNRGIGEHIAGDVSGGEQVTDRMRLVLNSSFEERRALYLRDRIDDQRSWYQLRAQQNKESSRLYFWLLVSCYGAAIGMLLVRIGYPTWHFLPIDSAAVAASAIISWKQLRRFDELASAYGLTSHELGIIKSAFVDVDSPTRLAAFVADAENAFSREHTQWAARRDH